MHLEIAGGGVCDDLPKKWTMQKENLNPIFGMKGFDGNKTKRWTKAKVPSFLCLSLPSSPMQNAGAPLTQAIYIYGVRHRVGRFRAFRNGIQPAKKKKTPI